MSMIALRPNVQARSAPDPALVARVVAARGAIMGAFGAGSLALWFLLIDGVARNALWSPSLVGAAILEGAAASAPVAIDMGLVASFSVVHCALFMAFGIAVAAGLHRVGVAPLSLVGVTTIAAGLQAGFVLGTAIVAPGLGDALGWSYVIAGNLVAAVTMAVCAHALPGIGDMAD